MNLESILEEFQMKGELDFRGLNEILIGRFHRIYELPVHPSYILKIREIAFSYGSKADKNYAMLEVMKENHYQEYLQKYLSPQEILTQRSFVTRKGDDYLIAILQEKSEEYLTKNFFPLRATYCEISLNTFSQNEYVSFHTALFADNRMPDLIMIQKFNPNSIEVIELVLHDSGLMSKMRIFFERIVAFIDATDQIPDLAGLNAFVIQTSHFSYQVKLGSTFKNELFSTLIETIRIIESRAKPPEDPGLLSSLLNGLTVLRFINSFLVLCGSRKRIIIPFERDLIRKIYGYSFSTIFD